MASSGSSSISNNDINPSCIYDVFLSFCDKDASESLASYLYTALTVAGIVVYKDEDKLLNRDQTITPSVLHAIESSRLSIIVFSKLYADSTWCRQELEKIMECRRTTGQIVVPVFYDVDPSGVLHQEGLLGEASKYPKQRILKKDKLIREVCNISGFAVHSRNKSEDIIKIVDHVTNLLDRTDLFVADHLVGVKSRLQDIIQLLNSQESKYPLLLGVWGMGGISKTTIAIEGFGELSTDVVKYSRGLPLALQVIGSFLLTRRRKKEWKRVLEKLTKPDDKIQEVLKLSFDNLSDNIKETFLDIACLNLSGMSLDDLLQIFKKDVHFTELGMEELVINGLVNLDSEKRIGMHDLVQLFGREIRKEKSTAMAAGRIYDVFLSFRGDDTHAKFISHLYTALENAGIYVFRDDDEIQRGDQVSVSLLQAIGQSRISIVVLSRNYANSRWCMLELENIMGISRTQGMVVVPVFYKIDPSEVRNQSGKFGEDFESLLLRMSVDTHKLSNWKRALAEVRGTAGVVIINSRNESEDITKIVDHVTNLLDRTDLFVADHPVGVDSRVQDVIQLLNSQESKSNKWKDNR